MRILFGNRYEEINKVQEIDIKNAIIEGCLKKNNETPIKIWLMNEDSQMRVYYNKYNAKIIKEFIESFVYEIEIIDENIFDTSFEIDSNDEIVKKTYKTNSYTDFLNNILNLPNIELMTLLTEYSLNNIKYYSNIEEIKKFGINNFMNFKIELLYKDILIILQTCNNKNMVELAYKIEKREIVEEFLKNTNLKEKKLKLFWGRI